MTTNTSTVRVRTVRTVRVLGWALLAGGVVVVLYLLHAVVFSGMGATRAQADLRDRWAAAEPVTRAPGRAAAPRADAPAPPPGVVAAIEFTRPGSDEVLVHDGPLIVLDDVSAEDLARGPGHYPGTARPGGEGNFAVAGHRTTYGAPFFHLDQLRSGDIVEVTAADGDRYEYRVAGRAVVGPSETWVIADDPLGTGAPTLTLTTCNPRFSAAERLVVHAELVAA